MSAQQRIMWLILIRFTIKIHNNNKESNNCHTCLMTDVKWYLRFFSIYRYLFCIFNTKSFQKFLLCTRHRLGKLCFIHEHCTNFVNYTYNVITLYVTGYLLHDNTKKYVGLLEVRTTECLFLKNFNVLLLIYTNIF